jgi:HlyD family secretion protein
VLICIAVIWLAHPALGTAAAAAAALVLALAVLNDRFTRSGIDALQQHADGGTVREVLVRDGERVREGQPLLVLGDVSVDADLNRLSFRVRSERISVTRLEAEQSMSRSLAFAPDLLAAAATDPRLAELMTKEKALFDVRRDALHGQVALLRAQREKVAQEIVALRAQIDQAVESAKFQRAELETNRDLAKEKFISPTRIAQLEGSVADYGVKIEERRSELARAEQRGVDTDLRIQTLESEFRRQASDQLKVTSARLSEVEQELRKFTDASMRQVIMGPTDGEVIDLKYSAPGAVIPPREVIAEIVPTQTRLVTEARIRTEDINRSHRG